LLKAYLYSQIKTKSILDLHHSVQESIFTNCLKTNWNKYPASWTHFNNTLYFYAM